MSKQFEKSDDSVFRWVTMLQVSGVTKSYGDVTVLRDVSFVVNPGDRVGLIGPNGCGKTTLLRIIVGSERPDRGSVRYSPHNVSVGYLAQALEFDPEAHVIDVMQAANRSLLDAEHQVQDLAQRMSTASKDELPGLMEAYAQALDRFEASGGYAGFGNVGAILSGLGLDSVGTDTPVGMLSGGQKTRLGLARLLQTHPQLLLLDEPTNHLDVEALEWLEQFLTDYSGAVLLVSHDRTFLDRTVQGIFELDPTSHTITAYVGSYSDYRQAKEREVEKQWMDYKDQQDRIEKMERAIRGLSSQARRIEQGTVHFHYRRIARELAQRSVVQRRRLERLLDSEDRVEKPSRSWEMKLDFEAAPASGNDVLTLERVSMGYGGVPLITDVDLTLNQGERVVLMGPNGSGKTTLLRGIVGALQPMAGQIRLGVNVRLGYYSQEQEGLSQIGNAFEEIRGIAAMNETEVRSFLHYFLFSGDDVFTPLDRLSFGERARLALAKLVATGCNFLLLDEPINHLDVSSRERFEQGLANLEGTVLAVVHDRYFIERFATAIWSVEDRTIRRYIDLEDCRRGRR
ncbi:MAG: ABC-F family ATP-binding cassette domain-containing protein [Chloroflexi bacterium]|nr:ABC-F family ATP-binding cassette domain-containing protein [Chloroflexota bacterium]